MWALTAFLVASYVMILTCFSHHLTQKDCIFCKNKTSFGNKFSDGVCLSCNPSVFIETGYPAQQYRVLYGQFQTRFVGSFGFRDSKIWKNTSYLPPSNLKKIENCFMCDALHTACSGCSPLWIEDKK